MVLIYYCKRESDGAYIWMRKDAAVMSKMIYTKEELVGMVLKKDNKQFETGEGENFYYEYNGITIA